MAVLVGYSSSMILLKFFVTTYFIHLISSQTCTPPTSTTVAFFNGSAYARVNTTFNLFPTTFKFRTCLGGTILQQTAANNDSFILIADVLSEKINISWNSGGVQGSASIDAVLNSGEITLLFEESQGSITVQVGNNTQVELAKTGGQNDELFSLNLQGSFLLIGDGFTGCVDDYFGTSSAGLKLCTAYEHENVVWGQCVLDSIVSCDPCIEESPCQNSGTCSSTLDQYTCQCTARYNGENCETDGGPLCNRSGTDFPKNCTNGGTCEEDPTGNFTTCECPTGYEGPLCETETDYCASSPCGNGTCTSSLEGYNCTCPSGEVCDVAVGICREDSCESTFECQVNGSGVICVCPEGSAVNASSGSCEDINECEPNPCQNNGTCQNLENMYRCNCTDTGFTGERCDVDIDECAEVTCQNNGTCVNKVNDYSCICHPGYEGNNCEIDVNECSSTPCQNGGTCLQNSNMTYYTDSSEYKQYFPGNFDYANANGSTCACQPGYTGTVCDEDVDECSVNPCQNGGSCTDGVNSFSCTCLMGWEGDNCTVEVKCDTAPPCQNGGTCEDNVPNGGYRCNCEDGYGGDHCEVELFGCVGVTCSSAGTCVPQYEENGQHSFLCNCQGGFRGDNCDIATTLSFLTGHSGLIDDGTFKDDTLDYTLTFRTTLPNGLLLFAGVSNDFFRLELLNGKLKLRVRDGREDVTVSAVVGESLNDGDWHKVDVMMNRTNVFVAVSTDVTSSNAEETCINGICEVLAELAQPYILGTLKIGVTDANVEGVGFIGCMRDIANLQSGKYFDQTTETATSELLHGCDRVEQCNNMTCAGNGACTDLWWESSCDCNSGFTGPNCTDSFVVGTFSFENSTSYATFDSSGAAPSPLENIVRLQFRTRQANGLLFLAQNETDYISIYLSNGQLKAEMSFASDITTIRIGSGLNDGAFHSVYFSRQATNVSLVVDSMENTTELSDSYETFFSSFYVGGVDDFSTLPSPLSGFGYFKGCLWDVKYNQYSLQFFPLTTSTDIESLPVSLTNVLDNDCASDNLCLSMPCLNGGTCQNEGLWNEFQCDCPYGYTGLTCESETICGPTRNPCPGKVTCVEKGDSYECVVEATFDESSRLRYEHNLSLTSPLDTISFRMRTRRDYGVILRAATSGPSGYFVTIDVTDSILTIRFDLGNPEVFSTSFEVDDGSWHNVTVIFDNNSVSVQFDDMTKAMPVQLNADLRSVLMSPYAVSVGGVDIHTGFEFSNVIGFIGCLEGVRIGDHLLPFFNETVYSPDLGEQFVMSEGEVPLGCQGADVCDDNNHNCQNGGLCVDEWNAYSCNCTAGYSGSLCDMEINECSSDPCMNGSTCQNQVADYMCLCLPGYSGKNCEENINECDSDPCQNGGTCLDAINEFECQCADNFTGKMCEFMVQITCDDDVCENNSTCVPRDNPPVGEDAFTCTCQSGYTGSRCSYPINYCQNVTCENGGTCSSNMALQTHNCSCIPGFEGSFCEVNIQDCNATICQNGGTCQDMIDDYECNCVLGFTGKNCQQNINDCVPDPCYAGICVDGVNSFICDCPKGYEGDQCQFRGPCSNLDCQNGANCSQTLVGDVFDGGCECLQGYTGVLCESEIDWCESDPCMNEANCTSTLQGANCTCNPGYGGDFCEIELPNCASDVCQNGANCTDFDFTYECHCVSGFDGTNCEINIDDCPGNLCENGECVDGVNNYTCDCNGTGFQGIYCEEDIDECASNPCQNGGTCENSVNEFKCECVAPYLPPTCTTMDPCSSNPCSNDGVCSPDGTDPENFVCDCTSNYDGPICEMFIGQPSNPPWPLIGGIIGGVILVILLILVVLLFLNIRKQRATAGTYSPSRQEISGSRVEMDNVLKLPPPERLI